MVLKYRALVDCLRERRDKDWRTSLETPAAIQLSMAEEVLRDSDQVAAAWGFEDTPPSADDGNDPTQAIAPREALATPESGE